MKERLSETVVHINVTCSVIRNAHQFTGMAEIRDKVTDITTGLMSDTDALTVINSGYDTAFNAFTSL